MGLFRQNASWERTFRLRTHHGTGRGLLTVLFWFWGGLGFLYNAGTLFGLTGSIGMGTSAYLAATALVWIGGMVLFGIGALLADGDFDGERPVVEETGDIRITQ
ncbi:hypothetical protein SAMN03159423_4517 [Bradyrhizobium sp. NFR13]|uniref:hypothetical protein n=1 Tax=Bradyrhizobium sp. NFR13 TaxID=1566285 RepID=UPI0008E466ED|nr:hypothetical protein [Bradyrhizobium sp. NFR13]SFL93705.1 hypothetical protein SAMN03159423_4517 [Bradyrhizobium sp. NFR13]